MFLYWKLCISELDFNKNLNGHILHEHFEVSWMQAHIRYLPNFYGSTIYRTDLNQEGSKLRKTFPPYTNVSFVSSLKYFTIIKIYCVNVLWICYIIIHNRNTRYDIIIRYTTVFLWILLRIDSIKNTSLGKLHSSANNLMASQEIKRTANAIIIIIF